LAIAVLDYQRHLQPEQRFAGSQGAAQSALAGMLALFLLLATTFSVSHALHQSLHSGAPGTSHLCLICSLVKGQVTAADVAPALLLFASVILFSFRAIKMAAQAATDRRLAASRAPPRSSFSA
jgi:hypothetical protein